MRVWKLTGLASPNSGVELKKMKLHHYEHAVAFKGKLLNCIATLIACAVIEPTLDKS